jgi:hypothetical protein
MTDDRPLHEKVFQLKAAIRRAGFVAHGRTRIQDGRVVMGVIMPVAFPVGDLTVEQVLSALRERVTEVCKDMAHPLAGNLDMIGGVDTHKPRPADLRTAQGRAWKRERAGAIA